MPETLRACLPFLVVALVCADCIHSPKKGASLSGGDKSAASPAIVRYMEASTFSRTSRKPGVDPRVPFAERRLEGISSTDLVRVMAGLKNGESLFRRTARKTHAEPFRSDPSDGSADSRVWTRAAHEARLPVAHVPIQVGTGPVRAHSALEIEWVPPHVKAPGSLHLTSRLLTDATGRVFRAEITVTSPEPRTFTINVSSGTQEDARKRLDWTVRTGRNHFVNGRPEVDVLRVYYLAAKKARWTRNRNGKTAVLEVEPRKVTVKQITSFSYDMVQPAVLEARSGRAWAALKETRGWIEASPRSLEEQERQILLQELAGLEAAGAISRAWAGFAKSIQEQSRNISGARSAPIRHLADTYIAWWETAGRGHGSPLAHFDAWMAGGQNRGAMAAFVAFAETHGIHQFKDKGQDTRLRLMKSLRPGLVERRLERLTWELREASALPEAMAMQARLLGGTPPFHGPIFIETYEMAVSVDAKHLDRLTALMLTGHEPVPSTWVSAAHLGGRITLGESLVARLALGGKQRDPGGGPDLASLKRTLLKAADHLAGGRSTLISRSLRDVGYRLTEWSPLAH